MPLGEALENNDDYVISLLTRDAEANKSRYLRTGLGSLLSTRSRNANAPKPNTRFLRNIVRDADAHNAALKAKEEGDSRARLRELRRGKRPREDDREGRVEKRRKGGEREGRWAGALDGLGDREKRRGKPRDVDESVGRDERGSRHRHERRRSRERGREDDERRHRLDVTSTTTDEPRHAADKGKRRRRSESSSSSRSRPPRREARPTRHDQIKQQQDQDSDPLDDIIGPSSPPKVIARGRGANKVASTIDTRFNPSYNPKTDVDLSPDEGGQDGERDDWDMALEALRDRAKWRVKGGNRLREAGFTEEEVGKWEKNSGLVGSKDDGGGGDKGVEDVRWAKKGEGREWDRGKVVGGEGGVDVKAGWGRLKDS